MSQANVDAVKEIVGAWKRGDFTAVDWADPEIEFSIPGPDLRVHHGIESMGRAWAEWLGAFDEFSVAGVKFFDAGDKVVVEQIFRGKGKGSGIPVDEIPGASVFTLRDGKVTSFEGHITLEAALASAGLES
ncbi:MAG TPA: nuclear transport factor 2 family protein [Solirubrobacterales bacterium]|jgi:ketosteroid isomerase-like protein